MDLTILVPTKNRHFHLKRLLNYYKNFQFKGFILIFDSSNSLIYKKNVRLVKNLNNKKISIIKYNAFPFQCFKNFKNKISTNFVCYCGDDDYFIVDGLKKSVLELKKNKNIIGVNGLTYGMEFIGSNYNVISSIGEYTNFYTMKNTPIDRINDLTKKYLVPLFSVFRTKKFREMLKIVPTRNQTDICPSRTVNDEMLESFYITFLGKILHQKFPFLIRSVSDLKKGYKFDLFENDLDLKKSNNFLKKTILKKIKTKKEYIKLDVNLKNFFINRNKLLISFQKSCEENIDIFNNRKNLIVKILRIIFTKAKMINYLIRDKNFIIFYRVANWLKNN